MQQLIEILSERPIIIAVLISWPLLLWVLKVASQKALAMYEARNK